MHTVNWDDLRYVLAIDRSRTLSGAAAALGVRHTTVSRRLQLFEEKLDVRLFVRAPDGMRPTDAGQDLAALAKHIEGDVLSAEARVIGKDEELRGPLRFSTLDFLFTASHCAFAEFIERYPKITVTTPVETVPALQHNSRVRAFMDHMGERLPKLLTSAEPER